MSDFELLLIDDGSHDNSVEVTRKLCETLSINKFKIICKENGGAGSARNLGISEATGDYIVFIDSDDYIDKDFLFYINCCINTDKSDVIFIDIIREMNNGTILRKELMSKYRLLSKDRLIRNQLTGKIPWGGVRKIVRRKLIIETGAKYATEIKVGEESIYSFLIIEASSNISFQTKAFYHYVENATSLTANDNIEQQKEVFDYIYTYISSLNDKTKYKDTLSALAITYIMILINHISKKEFSLYNYKKIKRQIDYYLNFADENIDTKSLDTRVRLCLPLIKKRHFFVLYIMAFIKNKIEL